MVALSTLQNHAQTRLVRRAGRWLLEFERFDSIDTNVLRPSLVQIEGEDFILRHLQSMPDGTMLAAEAMRLIHSTDASGTQDRAFEPAPTGWMAAPMRTASVLRVAGDGASDVGGGGSQAPSATAALAGSIDRVLRRLVRLEARAETDHGALTRQLTAITAVLERLADHLDSPELKESLQQATATRSRSAGPSKAVSSSSPRGVVPVQGEARRAGAVGSGGAVVEASQVSEGSGPATLRQVANKEQGQDPGVFPVAASSSGATASGAAQSSGEGSEGASVTPATGTDPGSSASADPVDPQVAAKLARDAAAEGRPKMLVPTMGDINRCLKQLIGDQITYKEEPKAKQGKINLASADIWASTLLDDEDFVIGAILIDRKASIMLGGTMLMMPEGAIKGETEPSEDMISASSEVVNVLSSAINNVPNNPHVRTTFLKPIKEHDDLAWLPRAVSRTDVSSSLGGQVLILGR